MLRPHVVIYSAVSIDGRITGYENDPAGRTTATGSGTRPTA
ncbi:hypothetical protein ACLKM7_11205 [Microbacterium sp. I2]